MEIALGPANGQLDDRLTNYFILGDKESVTRKPGWHVKRSLQVACEIFCFFFLIGLAFSHCNGVVSSAKHKANSKGNQCACPFFVWSYKCHEARIQ